MSGQSPTGWLPEVVVFDLDDTLIPQWAWLEPAASRVAEETARAGWAREPDMRAAMLAELGRGSDRPGVIDRALMACGPGTSPSAELVASLVEEFMGTRVPDLACYPAVRDVLGGLRRSGSRIGILTDGRPATQIGKIEDAGLTDLVDEVLVSDSLGGRELRKPNPLPLRTLLDRLGDPDPDRVLVVGDRPAKDTAVARAAGVRAWRVLTGEHADAPDDPPADAVLAGLEAVGQRLGVLPAVD